MVVIAKPPAAKNRRERKRHALADRVAAVAFDLFEEHGYEAVSMEQVGATADIAKGTLYRYFPVKEALLAHRFQRDIAAGMEGLWQVLEKQRSFAAQMKSLLHASARWHEARRRYIAHYVRYQFNSLDHGTEEGRLFERLCSDGQQRGDVRADLPAAQLAVMLECMHFGAIMNWLATRARNPRAEFGTLLALAVNGMGQ
jgi:AcrR family transcriptional regulator